MFSANAIGHLHPLLVHLPIGILLFAAGLMVFERIKKADLSLAISFAWGLGAATAILSCIVGWLLAQSGEYDADMVQKHQWTGIMTAALGTVTYFTQRYRWLPAAATVLLLTIAGHYGGNLTHGEDYLFPGNTENAAETTPQPLTDSTEQLASVADSVTKGPKTIVRRSFVYRNQVVPIMKNKCYSCHSATKKKGGLRLDSEAFIKQGGKNGAVLVAGNPQKSKLFTYLLLPEGDDRHMPPKGKLQLTREELGMLQNWIQKGASFKEEVQIIELGGDTEVAAMETSPAIPEIILPYNEPVEKKQPELEAILMEKPINAADQEVVKRLKEQHIALVKMADESEYLSANFVNTSNFKPENMQALAGVGAQVMRLRLAGLPVEDADIAHLAKFTNLTRLNLEKTKISDRALQTLAALPNLEQLNLYGTAVTDSGLNELAKYPQLKVVYLWQTKATSEGIKQLQKARPNLKIEAGGLQLAKPDTSKAL